MRTVANSGAAIAFLAGEMPLTDDDNAVKDEMLSRLSAAYKLDYYDETLLHCASAKDLFRRAVNKRWTASEFLQRLDEMTESTPFATWTPADFFKKQRPHLLPYSWALMESKNDRNAMQRMEAYIIPPLTQPLYRYADGEALEERYPDWQCVYRCGISTFGAAHPDYRLAESATEPNDVTALWSRIAQAESEAEAMKERNVTLQKALAAKEEIIISLQLLQQYEDNSDNQLQGRSW